jgi:hypothetical protein
MSRLDVEVRTGRQVRRLGLRLSKWNRPGVVNVGEYSHHGARRESPVPDNSKCELGTLPRPPSR